MPGDGVAGVFVGVFARGLQLAGLDQLVLINVQRLGEVRRADELVAVAVARRMLHAHEDEVAPSCQVGAQVLNAGRAGVAHAVADAAEFAAARLVARAEQGLELAFVVALDAADRCLPAVDHGGVERLGDG